ADLRGGTTDFLLSFGPAHVSLSTSASAQGSAPDAGKGAASVAAGLQGADPARQAANLPPQGGSDPDGGARAAFTLAATRTDSAPVTALGPVFQVRSLPAPEGGAAAGGSAASAPHETLTSLGSSGVTGEPADAPGRQLAALLAEAEGKSP